MKNITATVLAMLTAVLIASPAVANPLTMDEIQADYEQNVEFCKSRTWSEIPEIQALEYRGCLARARTLALEYQLDVCQASMRSEFEAELLDVQASLERIQAQLASPTVEAGPVSGQVAMAPVTAGVAAPVQGAAFRPVSIPSPVSIYNLPTSGELKVTRLSRGTQEWAAGQSRVRIVVLNHGMPMPVSVNEPGAPTGFVQVYADVNNDGVVDPVPYKAVDPSTHDTLYIGWKQHDDVQVWYLVPSGDFVDVQVNGQWVRLDVWVRAPGAGEGIAAYGGNRDGGNRQTSAHNGRKVW